MAKKLIIKNGTVYDPLNNVNGEQKDIFILDGKISEEFSEKDSEIINASGKVVMAGAVDIHSHIAGAKVNHGRFFRPEDHAKDPVLGTAIARSGVGYSVPSTFITGYRYAKMGYTTVVEPAMPPLKARHTHEEFEDTPIIDKAAFPLFGNNWFVMEYIKNGDFDKLKAYVAWLLKATKGYAVKIVNPGGVESWAWGKNVEALDSHVLYFDVTPKEILENMAKVNEELGLPHTIHIHGNNLGHPGNSGITLDTYDIVKKTVPKTSRDNVMHMTHAQFNSYGGTSWKDFCSNAADVSNYLNNNKHITIDVGQVVFSNTTTMTADGPWEFALHHIGGISPWGAKPGVKWVNGQVEAECGSGLTPYVFNPKNGTNAIQWAVGLELMLGVKNSQQIFLTTDHPNGGPFIYYPTIIKWLMSKKARTDEMANVHKNASDKTTLASLDREYTLYEIANVTRAGTSKCLGMHDRGHLGIGAIGDVAIYDLNENEKDGIKIEKAFSNSAYTIKDGVVVTRDGEILKSSLGKTLMADATNMIKKDLLDSVIDDVKRVWGMRYSVNHSNYAVQDVYCKNPLVFNGVK